MKIVIVGGGTAGYIFALYIKKYIENSDITVIDSKKIGVIGAGEGTTSNFNYLLEELDLPIKDFVDETGATLKNGINFINWSKNNKHYFHSLKKFTENIEELDIFNEAVREVMSLGKTLNDFSPGYYATLNNKIVSFGGGWHLDAVKLASFFEKHSSLRKIKVVDDIVHSFNTDDSNNIIEIIGNKGIYESDFVIDATGFKKFFIGNHYNAEWVDCKKTLPCTEAVAFFMNQDNQYTLATDIIAMDYGWAWKTPLEHRYGCGYVYDPQYATEEEIKKEILDKFEDSVNFVNKFKYSPGYFSTPWVNNCLAVGLASSFAEPLHATSIMLTIYMATRFVKEYYGRYVNNDKNAINDFNALIRQKNEELISFIYIHYLTDKDNTLFWKNFRDRTVMPDYAKTVLEEFSKNQTYDFVKNDKVASFGYQYWVTTIIGTGNYNKEQAKLLSSLQTKESFDIMIDRLKDVEMLNINDFINVKQTT